MTTAEPATSIITFRMSAAGYCPRRLVMMHLGQTGLPEPEWLAITAREGQKHEQWLIEELEQEQGYTVTMRQIELSIPLSETVFLVGHPEGLISRELELTRVLEIKTMSEFEYSRWLKGRFEAFPHYADQHTCYLEYFSRWNGIPVGGHYLVKNRNSGATDTMLLDQPPSSFTVIGDRLLALADCIRQGVIPEADYDPDSYQCRRCSYRFDCIKDLVLTPKQEATLTVAADQWRRSKDLERQSKELQDNAKRIFSEHSEATSNFKWNFQGLAIRKQNGRTSIDAKALRQSMADSGIPEETIDRIILSATKTGEPFYRINDTRPRNTEPEED